MKNLILAILLVIGVKSQLSAQQEPLFSQYWNARTYYNPSATGLNAKHLSTTLGRWQDVGVNGAPVTQLLGYAIQLKKLHGGLGFTYLHEAIGFSEFNKFKANYAYHFNFKNKSLLSIGIAAGFNHHTLEPEWIPPASSEDPALPQASKSLGFTSDFGIAYRTKKMNVSLSGTQLVDTRLDQYQPRRHFVFMFDYIFGNDNGFQFKPQVFSMTDMVKLVAEGSLMLLWKSKLGATVSYRSSENFIFSAHWDIVKKFRIGYSYDLPIAQHLSHSKGSHTGFFGVVFKDTKIKDVKKEKK